MCIRDSENGGYFLWSEHQEGVIENIVANTNFKDALERYGDSFISVSYTHLRDII